MLTKSDLLSHAGAAVDSTARSLEGMSIRLQAPTASIGRQHRLLLEGALHELHRRHELLRHMYDALDAATGEDVPRCWQKFFTCYDDYLEAARDVRSRLVQDEVEDVESAPPGKARRSTED